MEWHDWQVRAERAEQENRALHAQLDDARNALKQKMEDYLFPNIQKLEQELTAAQQRITALEEAISNEPELPGEIPQEMFETIKTLDKQGMEEYCRIIVRKTKESILRNAQPTQTKT